MRNGEGWRAGALRGAAYFEVDDPPCPPLKRGEGLWASDRWSPRASLPKGGTPPAPPWKGGEGLRAGGRFSTGEYIGGSKLDRRDLGSSDDDVRRLHEMGYSQELCRRLGTFSNFALSFSIICILAGGVTSFHLGFCSVGGAAIGVGWPLVVLFAVAVAATMGQLASAFPTAGGLYHWASLLGGRGWGWMTAWFNLAGLVTVLAAINVGTYRFAMGSLFSGGLTGDLNLPAQALGVVAITGTQAAINHLGIGVTARLTDFSGYLILLVTIVLSVSLLAFCPGLDPGRLVRFENFSGSAGGNVWPATLGIGLLFAQGLLLPAYTITGFDASAHAAEETLGAVHNVPRGILRSVIVSGVAGWVLLAAVVLAAPALPQAAAEGERAFVAILTGVLPRPLWIGLVAAIVAAQYLCGLATLTSASRMAYAFAATAACRGQPRCAGSAPSAARHRWRSGGLPRLLFFSRCTHPFMRRSRSFARSCSTSRMSCRACWCAGTWQALDRHGPVGFRRVVSTAGVPERGRLRGIDLDRNAATEPEIGLGGWRVWGGACGCVVLGGAGSVSGRTDGRA